LNYGHKSRFTSKPVPLALKIHSMSAVVGIHVPSGFGPPWQTPVDQLLPLLYMLWLSGTEYCTRFCAILTENVISDG
jgi:hypothetical protein